jgi:hypothetical protein
MADFNTAPFDPEQKQDNFGDSQPGEPEYFKHRDFKFRIVEGEGSFNGYPYWEVQTPSLKRSFSLSGYDSKTHAIALAKYLIDLREIGIGAGLDLTSADKKKILRATKKFIRRTMRAEDSLDEF